MMKKLLHYWRKNGVPTRAEICAEKAEQELRYVAGEAMIAARTRDRRIELLRQDIITLKYGGHNSL